jgi:hypothetical protein
MLLKYHIATHMCDNLQTKAPRITFGGFDQSSIEQYLEKGNENEILTDGILNIPNGSSTLCAII